ncbi:carbohydrate ABC transporter permease [Lacticaseibacillus nasuensis]|uniref:carbohydrate ABC transporter permease n=1 Tax=Lacticaseibacillus nasuensis TaxID=944671 RepID=UPI002247A954|nr:carbohydrate ABC transporter permease [Lacticaseibacillus nasuensis]MCX2455899.1 carbohydrate ABC transporter permease [Lacticaseibacillus nasuensis]
MKESRGTRITVNVIALILAVLFILPIYILVISSFKPESQIFNPSLLPDFQHFTLQNYVGVFKTDGFMHSIMNSAILATTITFCALFFHSMAGFAFTKLHFPGKNLMFTFFISTMMVPFAVIMIPLFQIVKAMGILNTLWAIILPLLPNAYGIFLYRQFFENLPDSLVEAARMDGLSDFGIYRKIALPLAKPITISLGIAFFVANWNSYLWPLIVAQDRNLWVLQVAMANFQGEHATAWNLVLAGAVVAALPTVALFIVFQKYIKEGLMTTGMKL